MLLYSILLQLTDTNYLFALHKYLCLVR